MNCPNCGNACPDGVTRCPSCGHAVTRTAGVVATGALTPPEGGAPAVPGAGQVDQLAVQLQAALGDAYQVERALGAGGFAVVYLVRDLHLKRKLAVKVLSPDLMATKTVLERFRREAETVAQLSHPHIVPLHFVGQKEDLLYLAMECVEGGSLADRLEKEGKLPAADVVRIVSEVASALAYAHKRGVVHRDIKPHNVLIESETGRSLVTDFGIARTAGGSSLTASGMMIGTPAYLSPEQVTGGVVDHRADIYALGVMAYEMLSGHPPFTGPTPTAVLMQRISTQPMPIARVRPDTPAALREAVAGMLAQDPERRYQSAAEVVRTLGGATPVSGGDATASRVSRRRQRARRGAALAAGGGFLVAAALLAFALARRGPNAPPPNPVDAGMVVIPAGTYTIGTDGGADARLRPAHQVHLAAFGMDVHEVTVRDYKTYVDAGRATAPWGAMPEANLRAMIERQGDRPVTGVTWSEASNYCAWKHRDGGTLPSEEQWEAAARGAAARRYPWGDQAEPGRANTAAERRGGPVAAGSYPRGNSPEGVEDLIGNVWEWTRTRMAPYPGGPPIPGVGPQSLYYVIRGGAWNTPDPTALTRGYNSPVADRSQLDKTGFRCVMPVRGARAG